MNNTKELDSKSNCLRCHRKFMPKQEGQIYGPVCARKLAGQVALDGITLVSGEVQHKKEPLIEVIE